MSNKKQTAVEWLLAQININGFQLKHIEQAKAMEKEQIMDAFINGEHSLGEDGEQYYKETYEK
jgi:hypothetical protein